MTAEDFKIEVYPLKNKLFRFSKRLLDDPEEAKDIVQDTFIRLWNKGEKLKEYKSIEALAIVTARNLCLDRLRARRYPSESIDLVLDEEGVANVTEKLDRSDVMAKIHAAMRTLPELQKTVIHLRDIEGYDYKEMAEMLDMNENAIRVNLSRARKRIRETLINQDIYESKRN